VTDIESTDRYGQTPLSWAAGNGHKEVVRLLLKTTKVEIDSKCFGRTPLSWAAQNGHDKVVELLLNTKQVGVDSKDGYDRTPLEFASVGGHDAVVRLLLEIGKADPCPRNKWGGTPLIYAKEKGHEAVVKLLLETGKAVVGAANLSQPADPVTGPYSFTLTDKSAREHGFNPAEGKTFRDGEGWKMTDSTSHLTILGSGWGGALPYTHENGKRFIVVLGIHN
jgi:ankyrin repeat protein